MYVLNLTNDRFITNVIDTELNNLRTLPKIGSLFELVDGPKPGGFQEDWAKLVGTGTGNHGSVGNTEKCSETDGDSNSSNC